jgi:hypothetical protein
MNLSGAVLVDWFHAASGQVVGVDAAVRIDAAAQMPVVSAGWLIPMALGAALGPILLLIGLARAKVVGWWIFAFPVVIVAVTLSGILEGPLGGAVAFALVALLGAVIGVGLWRASGGQSRPAAAGAR